MTTDKPMIRVLVTLPPDLLAQIDKARGLVPRAAWLRDLAEKAIAAQRKFDGGRS